MYHVEAHININEKKRVEWLLDRVLGDGLEVELLVRDSRIESSHVFETLEASKKGLYIAW